MRTKVEIEEEIKKLENAKFMINMIDHWTYNDSRRYDEICKELRDLRKELESCTE